MFSDVDNLLQPTTRLLLQYRFHSLKSTNTLFGMRLPTSFKVATVPLCWSIVHKILSLYQSVFASVQMLSLIVRLVCKVALFKHKVWGPGVQACTSQTFEMRDNQDCIFITDTDSSIVRGWNIWTGNTVLIIVLWNIRKKTSLKAHWRHSECNMKHQQASYDHRAIGAGGEGGVLNSPIFTLKCEKNQKKGLLIHKF